MKKAGKLNGVADEGGAWTARAVASSTTAAPVENWGDDVPKGKVTDFQGGAIFQSSKTEAVEVTGPITASLWVASSARDTDFTVKLVDVHPDGTARLLTDRLPVQLWLSVVIGGVTGAGGFLQQVIFGWTGYRLAENGLEPAHPAAGRPGTAPAATWAGARRWRGR